MIDNSKEDLASQGHELKALRGELWVILPFFLFSSFVFIGSFRYKTEASTVPMFIGFVTAILTGMRLFHILVPRSKIGGFEESGIAGTFDRMKEEIEEGTMRVEPQELTKEITFREEKKAFLALIGCLVVFLLLGYLVGTFFVILGTAYYYGYREKGPLAASLITMYAIVYLLLYKLFEAPADYGVVLGPILKSFHLLRG